MQLSFTVPISRSKHLPAYLFIFLVRVLNNCASSESLLHPDQVLH